MKVTLDVNILVSGTFWAGASFIILNKIDEKEIKSVTSKEIIEEYDKVINSEEIIEKIENKKLILLKVVQKVIMNSAIVEPQARLDIIKEDKDDNKILECAKEGKVDYIITQDNHLLKLKSFEGIEILEPDKFLEKVRK